VKLAERMMGIYHRSAIAAGQLLFGRGLLDTTAWIKLDEIGLGGPGRSGCQASPWRIPRRALAGTRITPDDVLLDLGSGVGRAVYVFARNYPFGRIIGLELAPQFNAIGEENIRRTRSKLRCTNVEFVTADASEYQIPDDVNYIYMNNPFTGELLDTVLENIVAALRRRPRALTIMYFFPRGSEQILRTGAFVLKRSTRSRLRRYPTPLHGRINVYTSTL
jgi:SAM-dependent methyltransferase